MSDGARPREVNFEFVFPDDLRTGVYANAANIWHSPTEFAFDGAVTDRPEADDPDDRQSGVRLAAILVSRVRIPVAMVFDVLQTLNRVMTDYERISGGPESDEGQAKTDNLAPVADLHHASSARHPRGRQP